MNFNQKIAYWTEKSMFLIVGLDIKHEHVPKDFMPRTKSQSRRLTKFIILVINLTAESCCGWKPNMKFYEGSVGRKRLENICLYIKQKYPNHINIGDNKDGDIGNTNKEALNYYVEELMLDAFTVNPLMGYEEGCDTYLSNPDVGVFTLCLTSNKGAKDFLSPKDPPTRPLYEEIAGGVAIFEEKWNKNLNYHLVVGGTNDPIHIRKIRTTVGDKTVFLMPGFGAQGGDYKTTIKAGRNSKGGGFLGVVARDIINPKLNENETFNQGVTRKALYWKNAFEEAARV